MQRTAPTRVDEYTAGRLASTIRKLEPVGVTPPRKILEAVTAAEQRIPAIEAQRLATTAMIGSTGPGYAADIAAGTLTSEQIIARLVASDLDPSKAHHAFRAAATEVGRTLLDTLADHGEKWVALLRPVIEERAETVYGGVYDPNSIDLQRDPHAAEYALRDDTTALAWGELNTLWDIAYIFHAHGILPHHGRRPDAYLFSSPTEERGEQEHRDLTHFIVLCREEHEPSLYTEDQVRGYEAEEASLPPRRRTDPYAGTGIYSH